MDELLVGTNVVARFFEVSARAIQQWAKAGCPKVKHGIYDLKAVHEWWLSNIADVTVKGSDDSMNAIKIEYWKAKGEAERIRVDQLSGSLISKMEVARQWARRLNMVFAGLDQLKNRLPPVLEGKSIREMRILVDDEIIDLQSALVSPGSCYPKYDVKKGESCQDNGKTIKRRRGRPRKSEGSNLNRVAGISKTEAGSSKSADLTGTPGARSHTKSPSKKSKRNLKKSTAKSKASTRPLNN